MTTCACFSNPAATEYAECREVKIPSETGAQGGSRNQACLQSQGRVGTARSSSRGREAELHGTLLQVCGSLERKTREMHRKSPWSGLGDAGCCCGRAAGWCRYSAEENSRLTFRFSRHSLNSRRTTHRPHVANAPASGVSASGLSVCGRLVF